MTLVKYSKLKSNLYITFIIIVCFQVNVCSSAMSCEILHDQRVSNCCKSPLLQMNSRRQFPAAFADCLKIHMRDENACGFQNCYGQRRGYVNQDGSLNTEGLINEYSNQFQQQPDILQRVKKRCIFANLTRFGNSCESEKLKNCIYPFMLMKCRYWHDYGSCKGIRQYIDYCATL